MDNNLLATQSMVDTAEIDASLLGPTFFRDLLGRIEDPVFVKNDRHQWIFANEAFCQLVGYDDMIGLTDADFLPVEQVKKFYDGDDFVIQNQLSLTQEEQIGDNVYALVKKIPIDLPNGERGLFGIIFNITEYRKVELEVEKLRIAKVQSLTDPLTGIGNRRQLEEKFEQMKTHCQSNGRKLLMLHIDVDHFKAINDQHGHAIGDIMLCHVAQALSKAVRGNDFVARIGGDEFVVLGSVDIVDGVEIFARRLVELLNRPFITDGITYPLSVSIGCAILGADEVELDGLLQAADIALYQAKAHGRNRFEPYTPELHRDHEMRRSLRNALSTGLADDQFQPFYQPQFCSTSRNIIGIEALARWHHPEQGLLAPQSFLGLAAAERRLVEIDTAILSRVDQDMARLVELDLEIPQVSVNVSAETLQDTQFLDRVRSLPEKACRLSMELLESIPFDELDKDALHNLSGLRDLGISIEIDDFGSGHSSIVGMLHVRPDRLKIDKQLVIPMTDEPSNVQLVRSIIQIANAVGVGTIAEGVETEDHAQLLTNLGCDALQGYGLARPMPFAALIDFLQSYPNR